jgi:hypothetical protein
MISKLLEITQIGSTRAGIFDLPEKHWPRPGQYLPCQHVSHPTKVMVTNLFRVFGDEDVLTLAPLPDHWYPGDQMTYLPPQGKGFTLPITARRIGLLAFGVTPGRLLSLIRPAMAQNAAVVLFYEVEDGDDLLGWLPSAIEVVSVSELKAYLGWLDYLAVDLPRADLGTLSALLGDAKLTFPGEVLIRTAMPCRGLGTCGVCAVNTSNGLRLACKNGPVFSLSEVRDVAQ